MSTQRPLLLLPAESGNVGTLFDYWSSLSISIRVKILNYFGGSQKELRMLTLLSKQIRLDCKHEGIKWTIVPLFVLSPLYEKFNGGSTSNFITQINRHQKEKKDLQRYRHLVINNVNMFDNSGSDVLELIAYENRFWDNEIKLSGIESLDYSMPLEVEICREPEQLKVISLPEIISMIVPNLLELNCTNAGSTLSTLWDFSKNCVHLEKVTWHNISWKAGISLNGRDMKRLSIKELYMDDCNFHCTQEMEEFDLIDYPNEYLFCKCCEEIEKISIQNAGYYHLIRRERYTIPQEGLMKFVRNAPDSLKWFRSDLTQTNIDLLHQERPDIELIRSSSMSASRQLFYIQEEQDQILADTDRMDCEHEEEDLQQIIDEEEHKNEELFKLHSDID